MKQVILVALLIALVCSLAHAGETKIPLNMLRSNGAVRSFVKGEPNECCLPTTFSTSGEISQFTIENNSFHNGKGFMVIEADYEIGKLFQSYAFTDKNQTLYNYSWMFRIGGSTVHYSMNEALTCTCSFLSNYNWSPLCFPETRSKVIGEIGKYPATQLISENKTITSKTWIFREPQMKANTCWMLNMSVQTPNTLVETNMFKMSEKINSSSFDLPKTCPALDKCRL